MTKVTNYLEKQTINQLATEVFAIIENKVHSHEFNEDDMEVQLETEVCIGNKDLGIVKFNVYQNVLMPSGGGGWDEAPYGYEADYQLSDMKVEIYNEYKHLPNVTKAVNQVLFENYYNKTI